MMSSFGFGKPGSFDKGNGFGGVMWGYEKECPMTNMRAGKLFLKLWERRVLSVTQMKCVRKHLCFTHELNKGRIGVNWSEVDRVAGVVKYRELEKNKKFSVVPTKIPSVNQIRDAFDKEWTPDNEMAFIPWLSGLVCCHDVFCNGPRGTEDIDRVKKSREHITNWVQGYVASPYVGGRAKLCGAKSGTRPWWLWTTCFCRGNGHQRPPPEFRFEIAKDGNPRTDVTWTSTCPVAALELLFSMQDEPRRYGKFLQSGGFGSSNIGDPVLYAMKWLKAQGIIEDTNAFDHNSGRKCFARIGRAMQLQYPPVFQVVGDLQCVWRGHYDFDLPKSDFAERQQSRDPEIATEAMRTFRLRILKRGRAFLPRMSRAERLQYTALKLQYGEAIANQALFGDVQEVL